MVVLGHGEHVDWRWQLGRVVFCAVVVVGHARGVVVGLVRIEGGGNSRVEVMTDHGSNSEGVKLMWDGDVIIVL